MKNNIFAALDTLRGDAGKLVNLKKIGMGVGTVGGGGGGGGEERRGREGG
jgi:hypothetical protein